MRKVNKIIIHCSDSEFGSTSVIDKWHKERGWDEIGYHFVITNGIIESGDDYNEKTDGKVEEGRSIEKTGAHCYGHNKDSIGICLIGKHHFTANQLCQSLPELLKDLMDKYDISEHNVFTHNDFNNGKTCPNFDLNLISI